MAAPTAWPIQFASEAKPGEAYTFGIHVQHEKGRGAQGMAKKGRGAHNFGGGAQHSSILV
jgi:hypothetical protein